jgi:hypothetical protein
MGNCDPYSSNRVPNLVRSGGECLIPQPFGRIWFVVSSERPCCQRIVEIAELPSFI